MLQKFKKGELVVDYRVPNNKIEEYCYEKYENLYYLGFLKDINEYQKYNFLNIQWIGDEHTENYVDSRLIRKLTKKERENSKNHAKKQEISPQEQKVINTFELGTKINAIICKNCNSIIYSRAGHDFRRCPCKKCAIDGGFEYIRVLFEGDDSFEFISIRIKAEKSMLYDDWNHRKDKHGIILAKK